MPYDPVITSYSIHYTKLYDFGQTLGSYGIGNGFYLMLPVLGPSSLRDAVGRAGDWFIDPINYAHPWELSWGARGLEKVNWISFHIGEYEAFKEASIDRNNFV